MYDNVQIVCSSKRRIVVPVWRLQKLNTSRIRLKSKIVLTTLAVCALFASTAVMADKDSDTDRSHPGNFVKDSAITTKIKSKLAAEHITSLGRIHVDTDKDGVVWLSGTARSQAAIDKAVSIARDTEHVVSVRNDIQIKSDD